MPLNDTLIAVFGGIFTVLALASLIGTILKFRVSPSAPHKVIDNLNARVNAWWAWANLNNWGYCGLSGGNANNWTGNANWNGLCGAFG